MWNRECRDLFELEPSEELEDEYSCALHKKILLQGRMYVFTSKVCFFSNVFGYITKKTLDLKAVTSVRKTNNMGFSNSIEIVYNGKVYFFTSFLYRNEAYKIIVRRWTAAAPGYARLFLGDDADGEKGGRHRRALSEGLRKEEPRSKGRSTISHGPWTLDDGLLSALSFRRPRGGRRGRRIPGRGGRVGRSGFRSPRGPGPGPGAARPPPGRDAPGREGGMRGSLANQSLTFLPQETLK